MFRVLANFMPTLNTNRPRGFLLLFEINIYAYNFSMLSLITIVALLVAHDPRKFVFLGALIPADYYGPFAHLCLFILHTYVNSSIILNVLVLWNLMMTYAFYLYLLIVREMKLKPNRKYFASFEFRRANRVQITFRSLQLLHQDLMLCCGMGKCLMAINALVMVATIYFIFVIIRFWEQLNVIASVALVFTCVFGLLAYTLLLEVCFLFFVGCTRTIQSWKRFDWGSRHANKEMKKFCRSCKPLVYSCGKQFVIGRVAIFNFYRGVTRGTCRALLVTD